MPRPTARLAATFRAPLVTPPEAAVPLAAAPLAAVPSATVAGPAAAALAAGTGTRSGTPGLRRASEPRSSKTAMLPVRSRGNRLLCHTRAVTVIWSFSASGAIRHHTRGSAI